MDYLRRYVDIVENARNRQVDMDVYTEKHHIIPKSIFENDFVRSMFAALGVASKYSKTNTVRLTAREHYVVHVLLPRVFRNKNKDAYLKMLHASHFMSSRSTAARKGSRVYATLKAEFSVAMSDKMRGLPSRAKGSKWTEERKRIGNPALRGKTYEQIHGKEKAERLKQARSRFRQDKSLDQICGTKKAEETRCKLSQRFISDEWRQKISKSRTGQKLSQSAKKKISAFMRDDKRNPHIDQEIFRFINLKTMQVIEARKYDMKKKFNCTTIHRVVDGRIKSSKGWALDNSQQMDGETINED